MLASAAPLPLLASSSRFLLLRRSGRRRWVALSPDCGRGRGSGGRASVCSVADGVGDERLGGPASRTSSPSWDLAAEKFFARAAGEGGRSRESAAENRHDIVGVSVESEFVGKGRVRGNGSRALLASKERCSESRVIKRIGRNGENLGAERRRLAGSNYLQDDRLKQADCRLTMNGSADRMSSRDKQRGFDKATGMKWNRNVEESHERSEDEHYKPVENTRWYKKINNSYDRAEGLDIQQRSRHNDWGRKTWHEGSQSSIPKMVGQGVYGVGPVLAALASGRREFFTLYIQEGIDLSGNNRKKKDKKGFEKVLQIADNIGLNVVETSKHDLNMLVDSRPHQGLVLDASSLEMINIRELEPATTFDERVPLWVALDEVTDPQNLGAIIRSAYYFGVEGIVLCAKNSAPLSGVVSKASAGSLELIELRSCKNMMQFLVSSSNNGWRVLGGSVSPKAVSITEVDTRVPTIVVLGSEGTGLRPLVERSCTQLVRIPGNAVSFIEGRGADGQDSDHQDSSSFFAVESLNVSVAAGVLLYHLAGRKGNFEIGMADDSTS